jgi:hypothetical protein
MLAFNTQLLNFCRTVYLRVEAGFLVIDIFLIWLPSFYIFVDNVVVAVEDLCIVPRNVRNHGADP